ncbi:phosphatase PAP2 family protein [Sphaerisporangium perillae]|uniref:phosphatase PAP2 family protein n=1 Tax=Sphaerisporangium perillae TaxID=2935860 RepID=UPI00200EB08C|nr:phosphatase PAP2 family protein [Sphaerisporangium perillae]
MARRALDTLGLPLLLFALALALGLAARTAEWTGVDLRLDEAVRGARSGPLTVAAQVLNAGFVPPAGVAMIALLTAYLFLARRPRTAVITFLLVSVGWTVNSVLKALIDRPRPPVAFQLVPQLGHDSFPSGHVALTMSLAIALAFLARRTRYFRLVVVLGVLLVVAQAMARLYLGVHYPTDVAGSILASTAGAGAVLRLSDRFGAGPGPGLPGREDSRRSVTGLPS